jgi:hypothetical protein
MSVKSASRSFLLLAVVTAAAAACGGSSHKAGTAHPTTLPSAVVEYTQCLKSHGVTVPSTPSATLPPSQVASAQSACAGSLPAKGGKNEKACLEAFGVPHGSKTDPHYAAASQICYELRKKSATTSSTT